MASNIIGHGKPTSKTIGVIGQQYLDLDTKKCLCMCRCKV